MYSYRAFGLQISSDIEIPEFEAQAVGEVEVTVRQGDVPAALAGDVRCHPTWQAQPGRFLLRDAGTARYLVEDGRRITVSLEPGAEMAKVRVFLLGSVFAALMQQRGSVLLHASAIATKVGAVLFVGSSGVGKSTLMSSMTAAGFAMMSDDVSALVPGMDGLLEVQPSFPRMRLWEDSVEALGLDPSAHPRVRAALRKYSLPVGRFHAERSPLSRIYLLSRKNEGDIEVLKLPPSEAFPVLQRLTYRKNFMWGMGLERLHFDTIGSVVRQAEVRRVRRPEQGGAFADLAGVIMADLPRWDT